jgi:hypothetical protein
MLQQKTPKNEQTPVNLFLLQLHLISRVEVKTALFATICEDKYARLLARVFFMQI